MPESVIEIKDLTKDYGTVRAVDHLTLSIQKGEVFGLLGPNGAGKSTTILMLLGLSEPTSGSVTVCGHDSTRSPLEVKKIVGYLPDTVGFYEDMTGLENLIYTARLNGIPKQIAKENALEILEQVGLLEDMNKKVGKYSRGMKQRLGLADVLIKRPEIIILDEPTLGLDPKGMQELLSLIQSLSKEEQITVLLSSHHLHQVQQICDRVGLFVKGKLLAVGNIEQLSQKLFADENIITTATVRPAIPKKLIEEISALESVVTVNELSQHEVEIISKRHVAETVSKLIVENGVGLLSLTTKTYGLDDIYHRYFAEGGANSHETN